MNWNKEILDDIEELAKLPSFTPLKIAKALGIEYAVFMEQLEDDESPIAQAYNKGQLLSNAEFDKKVIQLSNQGSGPAQTLQRNMKKESEYYKLLESYGK